MTKRTVVVVGTIYLAACVRPGSPPPVMAPPVIQYPAAPTAPASDPSAPATQAPAIAQQGGPAAAANQSVPAADTAREMPDSIHVSLSDVSRRAVEVFGDSLVTPAAPAAAADATAAPSWDIEVRSYESTSRVEHYVRMFSGPARDRIQTRLQRGTRYEPMIREKLRLGGLPEDMYYLALIESGFDPNAYSRAAAVGMWQFMTSTARDMGMRVDWWIDERRDPMKSTSAAVRFIKGLKEQFGSLYLAAAAYNGGPGRIARGLSRYADDLEGTTGDDLFFALADKDYLRNETREYVPQLIAAALIAKEPARYGLKLTPLAPIAYDSARVGPGAPLAAVARASGSDVGEIKELNPQVLRGVTPPKDSFWVRMPVGAADTFAVAYAALPKWERVGLSRAESRKGETISAIAARSGLTERQLSSFNPNLRQLKSGRLVAGQTVVIPSEAVAAAAVAVPDPSIERYSTSSRHAQTHVVKQGETLSGIARKYRTTPAVLMKANGLRRGLIFPGQSLVVGSAAQKSPLRLVSASKSKAQRSRSGQTSKHAVASKRPTRVRKPSGARKHASKRKR